MASDRRDEGDVGGADRLLLLLQRACLTGPNVVQLNIAIAPRAADRRLWYE
jgi:hypothetical protein